MRVAADYVLFNYERCTSTVIQLTNESDRMVLDTLGFTEEGAPTVPGDHHLAGEPRESRRYREISRRLAKSEGVSPRKAPAVG